MPEKRSLRKRITEWVHGAALVHSLLQMEFVRTALVPTVTAAVTAWTGYAEQVPLMWIFMATAVVFASVMQAMLRGSQYRERKTPLNKLHIQGPYFSVSLNEATMPLMLFVSRQQKRAQARSRHQETTAQPVPAPEVLSHGALNPRVPRTIEESQLGVTLRNTATFPISCILVDAKTEIAGHFPPRSNYPKKPGLQSPGAVFSIFDDAILMGNFPAQRLAGKMELFIKYGLPGKEVFDLRLRGTVDIVMEGWGLVSQVSVSWETPPT